jgi:hypothetical protein
VVPIGVTVAGLLVIVPGSQVYEVAPLASKAVVNPAHTLAFAAVAVIVGVGVTLSVNVVEPVQPEPLEPVRV